MNQAEFQLGGHWPVKSFNYSDDHCLAVATKITFAIALGSSIPREKCEDCQIFKESDLPRWDLTQLLLKLALSPYYQNTLSRYRRTWLQIQAEALEGPEKPHQAEVAG
jgi:hypothetical protein